MSTDGSLMGLLHDEENPSGSKEKQTRTKTACVQCHSRRSKCGALPPGPCPRCARLGLHCQWPLAHERLKRGRRPKRRPEDGIGDEGDVDVGSTRRASSTTTSSSPTLRRPHSTSQSYEGPDIFATLKSPPLLHHPPPPPTATTSSSQLDDWSWLNGFVGDPGPSRAPYIPEEPPHPQLANPQSSPDAVRQSYDLFIIHFGCQFPFLTRRDIDQMLNPQENHSFLLDSVTALAARFSTHPDIALPHLHPTAYGRVFYDRATSLVGHRLGTHSRENLSALLLLATASLGLDSEIQFRMMASLAINLCLEMGLHMKPPDSMPAEDRRLNKLLFWAVLMLDYTVSFSQGRPTTIRPEIVTVDFPNQEDIHTSIPTVPSPGTDEEVVPSPFPYAAQTIFALGPVINILASAREPRTLSQDDLQRLRIAWTNSAERYDQLPLDMIWNNANLQMHNRAHSAPGYIYVHVWNHTNQALRSLIESTSAANERFGPDGKVNQEFTPMSIQAGSWLHCARYIGDILVVADVVSPDIYLAVPLVSQCFLVATCCFAKDLETLTAQSRGSDKSRKMFATIAMEMIATLKQGLRKQVNYWGGLRSVEERFDARLLCVHNLEALGITERLNKVISTSGVVVTDGWLGHPLMRWHEVPAPGSVGEVTPSGLSWLNSTSMIGDMQDGLPDFPTGLDFLSGNDGVDFNMNNNSPFSFPSLQLWNSISQTMNREDGQQYRDPSSTMT